MSTPKRHVLMSLDCVGGVWRYALDLAAELKPLGYRFTFAGLGPQPSPHQRAEAEQIGKVFWLDAPLDWLTEDENALDAIAPFLETLTTEREIDLVQLNLPSLAAGLKLTVPVLVVSHSCVVTWFATVRGTDVPSAWGWQKRRNRAGLMASDRIVAPSHAHAAMLEASYGALPRLAVVHNGSRLDTTTTAKDNFVFAAGRWWDEGKNGAVLDATAPRLDWPVLMAGAARGPDGQAFTPGHLDMQGELPHVEIRHLMARAAILCSPSIYEPFGLAALEAAATGTALVLSDIPTYRELWDGVALFAPPHDAEAFVGAINGLARDPALCRTMGERARQRAQRFNLAAQAHAMHASYQDLLNQPSIARRA